jgi:hypothetical protein
MSEKRLIRVYFPESHRKILSLLHKGWRTVQPVRAMLILRNNLSDYCPLYMGPCEYAPNFLNHPLRQNGIEMSEEESGFLNEKSHFDESHFFQKYFKKNSGKKSDQKGDRSGITRPMLEQALQ